MLKGILLEFK